MPSDPCYMRAYSELRYLKCQSSNGNIPTIQPTYRETTFWLNALNLNRDQSSWQLYTVIHSLRQNHTCMWQLHVKIRHYTIIPSHIWSHCVDITELTLRRVCVRRSCIYLQSACESTLNGFSSAVLQMWLCNWKHEETTLHGTASVRYTVGPLSKDTSEISTPWLIRTLDWVATLYINTNYSLPEIRTPHLSVHSITREYFNFTYYTPTIHLAMFQPDLDLCQAKLGLSVQHRTIILVPRGVFILDVYNKC